MSKSPSLDSVLGGLDREDLPFLPVDKRSPPYLGVIFLDDSKWEETDFNMFIFVPVLKRNTLRGISKGFWKGKTL